MGATTLRPLEDLAVVQCLHLNKLSFSFCKAYNHFKSLNWSLQWKKYISVHIYVDVSCIYINVYYMSPSQTEHSKDMNTCFSNTGEEERGSI